MDSIARMEQAIDDERDKIKRWAMRKELKRQLQVFEDMKKK